MFYLIGFLTALILYGMFSQPTPDEFGWIELSIGSLLFLSLRPDVKVAGPWGIAFLGYGLSMPVIMALSAGHDITLLMRDVIPFLFLLMPLFYRFNDDNRNFLTAGICFIGLGFSLRSLITGYVLAGAFETHFKDWSSAPLDFLYLPNSPEVLFTALLAISFAFLRYDLKPVHRIAALIILILVALSMIMMMQRANLAYTVLFLAAGLVILFGQKPKQGLIGAGLAALALYFVYPFIADIGLQLWQKTEMVGLNSRVEEWKTVFALVSQSMPNLLFGLGWGAEFENPAVAELNVNFTHSLISSLLLKTGLCGLVLFIVYGLVLLNRAWPLLKQDKIMILALAGPLLIGFVLYASYKSLGYGLLLLLLSSYRLSIQRDALLEKPVTPVS